MDGSDGSGRERSSSTTRSRPASAPAAAWSAPAESWQGIARRLAVSPWWRGAAAVCAGALPALAFPAPSLWWLAYVALVPWMLLARSARTPRRATLDGWLGGLGFMLAVHQWLLPSLHVFTVVIAALLGALWAPWGGSCGGCSAARPRADRRPLPWSRCLRHG